jgi:aminocarboxymuconate-semialdehyde decarboxylase
MARSARVIDMHCHVVPHDLDYKISADDRWPAIHYGSGRRTADVVISGRSYRTVSENAWDLSVRRAEMERDNVTFQLLSPMPELFSYWASAPEAAEYCTRMNAWIAEAVGQDRVSFAGLGILPMQSVELALAMIPQIRKLGLVGVELGSNINEASVASPEFRPVLASLAAEGLLIFVHSFKPPLAPRVNYAPAAQAITFPLDIAFALQCLILEGVFIGQSTPNMLFSHGGGAAALSIARLQSQWETSEELQSYLPTSPIGCARRAYYDCLTFSGAGLQFLLESFGPSQVMMGSDYPFSRRAPGWPVDEAPGFDVETRAAIEYGNARRLLREAGVQ